MPEIPGVRIATAEAGIKYKGRTDLMVMVFDEGTEVAGVFTRSKCPSAPVDFCRQNLPGGKARVLVVNSGNANAFTGKKGREATALEAKAAAAAAGCKENEVFLASTGVIGEPLAADIFSHLLGDLVKRAEPGAWKEAAQAIMTTDTYPKYLTAKADLGGVEITINGIAKGAGMIAPDMATLLVFIVTDAAVDAATARWLAREVGARPFNELTVDGDTSTNDTLYLLASGAAGNPVVTGDGAVRRALARAVDAVAGEIARLVACDGEGTTKVVTIHVQGARSEADAVRVARTVGRSQLVKTAFFGADPNWGRIACAIGYSGVAVDPQKVSIRIGGVEVFRRGGGIASAAEAARAVMQRPEFDVTIRLGQGRAQARLRTSDLSHDYVELNSAYST